jgi:phosphatidylglycerol lysyltransferase
MKQKILKSIGPLFGLVLFTVVIFVLHNELKKYSYHDITRAIEAIPSKNVFMALIFTLLNYLVLTGYDALALQYIRYKIAYAKIALTSFIGYAFSQNMGFFMLSGGSMRFHIYPAWGLSALEITKVIAFCALTFFYGLTTVSGITFIVEPSAIPKFLHLPFDTLFPLGILLITLPISLVFISIVIKKPIRIKNWEFQFPSTGITISQILLSSFDWLIACNVLYVLIPQSPELTFPKFLCMFLLAQISGIISQVPGGLGVFETVLILLLSPILPSSSVLGSLIAYRAIYYLLPLAISVLFLGSFEMIRKRHIFKKLTKNVYKIVSRLTPYILTIATFWGGTILLFSGALPAESNRMAWLKDFLPLPFLEISHFLGSLTGVGLLILARGLQRRLNFAYHLTIILLYLGIIFSLLKGLDFEEALIQAIVLVAFIPSRHHFYRKASILSERFTPGWIAAITLVIMCSVWFGMFSYKHVDYTNDIWWTFAFKSDASRFLRASVGAVSLVLFFTLAKLFKPAVHKPKTPDENDMITVKNILSGTNNDQGNLALLGDKSFLFNSEKNAFVMYSVEGRSWIALGDPVGPYKEHSDLVWEFRELCDEYDGWTVFYEVGEKNLSLYLDLGLNLLKLGEEARVLLENISLEGRAGKEYRYTIRKLDKEGYSFDIIQKEQIPSFLDEFKSISDSWLDHKNTKEKGFSLGFYDEDYLKLFPAAIVKLNSKVVAFANIFETVDKEVLSIDLMRYLPDLSNGLMDYLFINLFIWGKNLGYKWFDLGMAPFAGLEDNPLAPLRIRLGAFLYRFGEHFYNFKGLRQYKEKFNPVWHSKYLASPGGIYLPLILTNLASLVSGGIKGVIRK